MTQHSTVAPSRPPQPALLGVRREISELLNRMVASVDRLMTRRRLTIYSVTFVVLGAVMLVATAIQRLRDPATYGPVLPDYLAHWTGGRMLVSHDLGNLYSPMSQGAYQSSALGAPVKLAWFVSPPLASALYAPFALIRYDISAACWFTVSTASLIWCLANLKSVAPRVIRQHRRLTILAVLASAPTLELLGGGQDTALMLAIWLAGIALIGRGRPALAGAVFALGLFKPQHVVLVPVVLVITRRFRALAGFGLACALTALLTVELFGVGVLRHWLSALASPLYLHAVQEGQAWKMVSLPSLVLELAPPSVADWLAPHLNWSIALGAVLLIARIWAHRRSNHDPHSLWMAVLATTIVFSPHVALYDAFLLIPVALFLLERRPSAGLNVILLASFWLLWLAPAFHELASRFGWPLSTLGAPWAALPIFLLWREMMAEVSTPAPHEPVRVTA